LAGNKISNTLTTLSSAAIIAIYAAGFHRTAPAAARFAAQTEQRLTTMPVPTGPPVSGLNMGLPGSYRPPAEIAAAAAGETPEPASVPAKAPAAENPVLMATVVPETNLTAEPAQSSPVTETAPASEATPAVETASATVPAPAAEPEPAAAVASATTAPAAEVAASQPQPEATVKAAEPAPAAAPAAAKSTKAEKAPNPPKQSKPGKDVKPTNANAQSASAPAAAQQPAQQQAEAAQPAAEPAAPAAPVLRDGTYYGWGTSRHGDIQAEIVINAGRISSARISRCETRYPCSYIENAPGQVIQRQSPAVDVVAGCTQSIYAFYYAVLEALAQAK
jgi:uncharacterized protein with FMN-binding domain